MYACNRCSYTTDTKCNLDRHMNRKVPCAPLAPFTRIDEKTIECNACKKILHSYYGRHAKTCKGVPHNTCPKCQKQFNARSTLSQHQKKCDANALSTVPPKTTTNGTTIINIHHNNHYNDNRTYIQNNVFGHEDFASVLNRLEEDPRLRTAVGNLKTTLSLVYFNTDFPENQTVRKLNKRSDTIELRRSTDPEQWETEPFDTGIQKILRNIRTKTNNDYQLSPMKEIEQHIHYMSKHKASTSDISSALCPYDVIDFNWMKGLVSAYNEHYRQTQDDGVENGLDVLRSRLFSFHSKAFVPFVQEKIAHASNGLVRLDRENLTFDLVKRFVFEDEKLPLCFT